MATSPTSVTTVVFGELEKTSQEDITSLPSRVHLPPSQPEAPTITTLPTRRSSRLTQGWTKPQIHKWRSPLLMILFFTLGLSVSIAHCIFYPKLKGKLVGNSGRQEQNLRFGTAFAFLAQICLGACVWTAHTQWLWRSVQRKAMTVAAWNSAFGADTSVFSLLNWEMLRKIRVGSAMALFAWSLLLPPFFTPATLFIYESIDKQQVNTAMPYPSIANASAAHKFSYSPPIRRGTVQLSNDTSRMFAGSRTALNLISAATSSLGQILPIDLPYNDSSYSVSFYAPIVKCSDASGTNIGRIDAILREEMATVWDTKTETNSTYFAFVPTYNSTGELTATWRPRQQSPSRSLNELWMTFLRATIDDHGNRVRLRHYQVCRLYNASYSLSISQYHGVQSVSGNYTTFPSPIPFPTDTTEAPSNMAQHAYAAFMWVMSDQLVGKFAWYDESSNTPSPQVAAQFGVIDSPIQRTSLLGSRDLDTFFEMDELKGLYANQNESDIFNLSDQRLRDKDAARNRTLDVLIEELSFNLTVSLMHNALLTDQLNTTITRTRDVNRYNYKRYGLFIPYALANVFAFLCLAIGLASFVHDGPLPGRSIRDIIWAARNWAVHGRPSLTRTMSMGVGVDDRGDIQIQVVEMGLGEGEKVGRKASVFESVRWRRGSESEDGEGGEGEEMVGKRKGGVRQFARRWIAGACVVLGKLCRASRRKAK